VAFFRFEGDEFAVLSLPAGVRDATKVPLSEAERAVLSLVLAGLGNAEIAKRRGRSPRTIANQVASIFRKLSVSSRFELLAALRG
jgi:DNA-binding CsgD family transcriptional regulator